MNASPNPFRLSLSVTPLEDRTTPSGTSVLPGNPYIPPLPPIVPVVVIGPIIHPARPCPPQGDGSL